MKILIICILATTSVVFFLLFSDMTYQKDVWEATAGWCEQYPTAQRCQEYVSGKIEITHWYTYLLDWKYWMILRD